MGAVNLSKQTVNLSKGDKINLSKSAEGLRTIMVGLGWDPAERGVVTNTYTEVVHPGFFGRLFGAQDRMVTRQSTQYVGDAQDIDCDAWLALLHNGKLQDKSDVVYYGNLKHKSGAVKHQGDNLTGEGEGDDEQIMIYLNDLPDEYDSIVIGVTIYQGAQRHQSFGSIKNTFIRVVDTRDNFEICRFNQAEMSENPSAITFIAGKLYKDKGEWQFTAIGKCTMDKSISEAATHYMYG